VEVPVEPSVSVEEEEFSVWESVAEEEFCVWESVTEEESSVIDPAMDPEEFARDSSVPAGSVPQAATDKTRGSNRITDRILFIIKLLYSP
jgi:hypothetical protein